MAPNQINVLLGRSDAEWSRAVEQLFVPRGIRSMVAGSAGEAVDILERSHVQLALLDMDSGGPGGLSMVRAIRGYEPFLPCITVSSRWERPLLGEALELNVFSVIAKPVDMQVLQEQLNKLFIKQYNSDVFSA
ncbi:MAG: response regulator [Phycisphaerae bacterium]|nr:response regulator [Phycisphaerae bacterium]